VQRGGLPAERAAIEDSRAVADRCGAGRGVPAGRRAAVENDYRGTDVCARGVGGRRPGSSPLVVGLDRDAHRFTSYGIA